MGVKLGAGDRRVAQDRQDVAKVRVITEHLRGHLLGGEDGARAAQGVLALAGQEPGEATLGFEPRGAPAQTQAEGQAEGDESGRDEDGDDEDIGRLELAEAGWAVHSPDLKPGRGA